MARGTVNNMLPKIRAVLSQQPVVRAWLFGSYSRGEETPDSDVDILVQYDEDARITLLTISRIMIKLSDAVGRKVDLVSAKSLFKDRFRSNLEKEVVYVR